MAHADEDSPPATPPPSNSKREKKKKLHVEMSALTDTSNRVAPVVGYFSSGYNPADSAEPPEVSIFRNKNHPSSRVEVVVKPRESSVAFVGKSYEGEAAIHQPCHYALGILDKDTQTLKVVPIAANKIFRLEPRIPKSISAEGTSGDLAESTMTAQSGKNIKDLTSIYGSKKQKTIDKKWKLLAQQKNDPSAHEELKGETLDADMSSEALEDTKETVHENIPPHDLSAVTPEKAYPLDEIILRGERDYLFDILQLLQSGIDEKATFWEENHYPSFVIKRIHRLKEIQDEEEQKKHAFILSYITHLVNFWKLASTSKRRVEPQFMYSDAINKYKIPRVVYQKFVRLFLDPVSSALPSEKRELVIGYVLVLTMFADSFSTDPSDISKDLGIAVPNLRMFFRQLGCKGTKGDGFGKVLWILPLPLKPFRVSRKRRR